MQEKLADLCPFCGNEALVSTAEMVPYPSQLHHVMCPRCGDYELEDSLADLSGKPTEKLKKLPLEDLDLDAVTEANKETLQSRITPLWIGSMNDLLEWEDVLEKHAQLEGFKRHKAYALPYYLKSAQA